MSDAVNSPKHYNSHESGIECIDLAGHMGFALGNAFKDIKELPHDAAIRAAEKERR
jgi:hypothetical protein